MKNTRGGDNLRQDAPRREEHASARHKCTHAAFYLALSSSPSARCRRHSVRPPRERNSSLRGLINDHWIFQRRRNHFHLLRYLGAILRLSPPSPPDPRDVRRIFWDTSQLLFFFTPVIVSNVNVSFRFLPRSRYLHRVMNARFTLAIVCASFIRPTLFHLEKSKTHIFTAYTSCIVDTLL